MEENKKQELKLEIAYSLMISFFMSVLMFGLFACANFWEAFRLTLIAVFGGSTKEPLPVDEFLIRAIPLCVLVFVGGFIILMFSDKKDEKEKENE